MPTGMPCNGRASCQLLSQPRHFPLFAGMICQNGNEGIKFWIEFFNSRETIIHDFYGEASCAWMSLPNSLMLE